VPGRPAAGTKPFADAEEPEMLTLMLIAGLILAAAIALTAAVVPSVEIDGGVLPLLGVALLFGLVNALVGPLLRLIALPITVLTFGIFALVVNGALLALTAGLSDSLDVGGFLACVVAALLISLLSGLLTFGVGAFVGGGARSRSE
jgi:putative membrane protein